MASTLRIVSRPGHRPGLAPYWIDLQATSYAGTSGRTALRVEAAYEMRLTQRLMLTSELELNANGKDDPARPAVGMATCNSHAWLLSPIAAAGAPGAWWYRGWRVMALNGSTLDVADERTNAAFFGYPGASCGQSAFTQTRLLALVECGTHAITAAAMGPFRDSERAMAARLRPDKLRPHMLVLANGNFYTFKLWRMA